MERDRQTDRQTVSQGMMGRGGCRERINDKEEEREHGWELEQSNAHVQTERGLDRRMVRMQLR